MVNILLLLPVAGLLGHVPENDVETADTLSAVVVMSDLKQSVPIERLASPVSTVYLKDVEDMGLATPKDLSAVVPNLLMPDYGSAMTSTVYLRGFGSRMDNPVMGLYVDGIPVLNKNSYDFDLYDIRRIDLFRGPQGTLYGRNSMCGVLSVSTLSPSSYQGTRAGVEYGAANSVSADVSSYHRTAQGFAMGGLVAYRHTDGFYRNEFSGRQCDRSDALSLRLRTEKELVPGLFFENILSASALGQGGWPYRLYSGGVLSPVSYDGPSEYRRLNITDGVIFRYFNEGFNLSSVMSWQFLADDMLIDQDFTPASMFSLNQTQREHAVTCEFILKPEDTWRTGWWNWQTGISGFWRHNRMSAPVTSLEDGIVSLIEDNVNGIFQNLPLPVSLQFDIAEDSFDIGSDFLLGSWNAAAYHESWFNVGKWLFSVGARLDYERYSMDYDSAASVHYSVSPIPALDKRPFSVEYAGSVSEGCLEFIPKVSVLYDFGEEGSREGIRVYMTASKGYRAGGFNTQIFSDILQNMMTDGMMADAMGQMMQSGGGSGQSGTPSVTAEDTAYRPERSFNYEAGCNFNLVLGKSGGHRLGGSASVFYIDCRDQQMTCFPPGEGTGRMMANIGRSRSAGAELTLDYEWKGFSASASCGYADARFVRYNDGTADWSGNRIPYSPESTLFVRASYDFGFGRGIVRGLAVAADVSGTGRIWWNEANTLHSPFRAVAGADVSVRMKMFEIRFRADNLSGEEYPVFYFRSVGNDFFQMSRPFRWSVALRFEL